MVLPLNSNPITVFVMHTRVSQTHRCIERLHSLLESRVRGRRWRLAQDKSKVLHPATQVDPVGSVDDVDPGYSDAAKGSGAEV